MRFKFINIYLVIIFYSKNNNVFAINVFDNARNVLMIKYIFMPLKRIM